MQRTPAARPPCACSRASWPQRCCRMRRCRPWACPPTHSRSRRAIASSRPRPAASPSLGCRPSRSRAATRLAQLQGSLLCLAPQRRWALPSLGRCALCLLMLHLSGLAGSVSVAGLHVACAHGGNSDLRQCGQCKLLISTTAVPAAQGLTALPTAAGDAAAGVPHRHQRQAVWADRQQL